MSQQPITGFHQDVEQYWVADLACGHTQHVRHDPPWQVRLWVLSAEGRHTMLGRTLECRLCDAAQSVTNTTASANSTA